MGTIEQLQIVGNETPEQAEAISLHYEIMAAAQVAASSLLDLGRKLKRMRDTGRYKNLGFGDFGEYTEKAVGIRQRQAYNYIGVVEKLPAKLIEENAAAGVTKLALLAKLGPSEREEVAENLANITVAELQKLIEEKNGLAEQLSIFKSTEEQKKPTVESEAKEIDVAKERQEAAERARAAALEEAEQEHERREKETQERHKAELEKLKAQQADAVAKATAKAETAAAEKIKQAKKEAKERADKLLEVAKKDAAKAAEKAQQEKDQAALLKAQEEAKAAQQRAEEVARQMKLNGSAEGAKFALLFEDMQQKALAIMELVDSMEGKPEAEKFRKALSGALRALADLAEGTGEE